MTFSSAVKYLKDGRATKVPSMRGYVKRVDKTPSEGQLEAYDLVFVEGADTTDNDGKSSYTYSFTVSTDGITTVTTSSPLSLDALLLRHLLSDAWETGDVADFEAVRSGTGLRW